MFLFIVYSQYFNNFLPVIIFHQTVRLLLMGFCSRLQIRRKETRRFYFTHDTGKICTKEKLVCVKMCSSIEVSVVKKKTMSYF